MRSSVVWKETLKDRSNKNISISIADVEFSPDSNQVLVAAGKNIHVYSSADGTLVQTLSAHKDYVACLSYSRDGKKFASGAADKQVIIWNSNLMGVLKFSHSDGIRCMQFNPVTYQLVSCTARDFGFWSADLKQVPKFQVESPVNDCSWSSDGHHLALALAVGFVSIRNRSGEETHKIDKTIGRTLHVAILGVSFCPKRDEDVDILAVVDQNQALSFYDSMGKQIGREKSLGFDALSIEFMPSGEYVLISGSNRKSCLYTKDGIFISNACELSSWVLSCASDPSGSHVVIGTEGGEISVVELLFSTVHSLYKEHYAYRNSMTDVIIQHLITEEKVRIKCRDLVKKLAIYKDRLAIQLTDKIVIYELLSENQSDLEGGQHGEKSRSSTGMHYKVRNKINHKNPDSCTLLVVGASNVILCEEKKLQCVNFDGLVEREWIMESFIRYVKPTGGPPGKEGILLGLRSGQVVQIFINNPFPIPIVQLKVPVRCLDMSVRRRRLAVIDDRGSCSVYDAKTKELLYHANVPDSSGVDSGAIVANSVAFNSQVEDMLCFSGSGLLCVKCDGFLIAQQPLQGFVVGFVGAKIFCLDENSVSTIEISQTKCMIRYIEEKKFQEAYQVSCLKVTPSDWEMLASAAASNFQFEIAKKAFWRTNNYSVLQLIDALEKSSNQNDKQEQLSFLGDLMAHRNAFALAVKYYKQAGREDKAINMYTDMKMFDKAQELIRSADPSFQKQLAVKKAAWVKNINEPRTAAEMYLMAGEYKEAIDIITQHGWMDMLMTVFQQLNPGDRENLLRCAQSFLHHKQYFNACQVYQKIGDLHSLVRVYGESNQWEEAFNLLPKVPELKQEIYAKYASFLAEHERFTEAQAAFHNAGLTREALSVLQTLTSNAIDESRFADAAFYSWILSRQCLDLLNEERQRRRSTERQRASEKKQQSLLEKYHKLQSVANIYYAYDRIFRFIEQPFTSCFPDTILNTARYLYHEVIQSKKGDDIPGVSKVVILYALVKQCRNLGAYRLARTIYSQLRSFHIPKRFGLSIEMGDLTIRAKPFSDSEELLPLCYRCSTTNPLTHLKGNQCVNCQQEFVFSFASFDVLPIVEFEIEEGISDKEAVQLIETPVPEKIERKPSGSKRSTTTSNQTAKHQHPPHHGVEWDEEKSDNIQSLKIRDSYSETSDYTEWDGNQFTGTQYEESIENHHHNLQHSSTTDLFMVRMSSLESVEGRKVVADRNILLSLRKSDVFIADRHPPLRKAFYRNLVPDMNITMCPTCHRFFLEDLETYFSEEGACPFCRSKMTNTDQM